MNFVQSPDVDDYAALFSLSRNLKLKNVLQINEMRASMIGAYTDYLAQGGNVEAINPVGLTNDQKEILHKLYGSPPKKLSFISSLRDDNAHKVCAMCGSFGSETLDHVLPKGQYPEFSVFSSNLVPACPCNSKRSDTAKGLGAGQRVLHPYFDSCLSGRLISMDIGGPPGDVVLISLKNLVSPILQHRQAVQFHIDNVVMKTAVIGYLEAMWAQLWREPDLIIPGLPASAIGMKVLKRSVVKELRRLDQRHGSKNNWESIFVSGLLTPDILQWLAAHISARYAPGPGATRLL